MIGSVGETEVTGTTRTKMVRKKNIFSKEATTASELGEASPLAVFKHCFVQRMFEEWNDQQHKEIL